MKTLKHITFALISIFFLNSCDDVKDLTEFDFDTTVVEEVTFTADASGNISETTVIDLGDNEDIKDYLGKIENIEIISAKYTVIAFNGAATDNGIITATLGDQVFGPYTHASFLNDFNTSKEYNFEDTNKLSIIANNFKDTNKLNVTYSGEMTTEKGFTMTVKIALDVNITAKVL